MGEETPTSEGKAAEESVCFEYWVTQPLLQKGAYEGVEPTNKVKCCGDMLLV